MAVCMTCGTETDDVFMVSWEGRTAAFDCIECLATMVSPRCRHCGCRILGHPLIFDGDHYCCAHCVRQAQFGRPASVEPSHVGRWNFGGPQRGFTS